MTTNKNKDKYWLAFASIEEIGSTFIKRLYDHYGCIKSAWCAGPDTLYEIEGNSKKQVANFLKIREKTDPDECLKFIQDKGLKFINFDDTEYPYLLKQISNHPMTLFYKGDFSRCNLDRTLSVVGSRKASEHAKKILAKIISEFRGTDICIVSGLASGIDTCAHRSAIENNLSTIGVIGSGFDFVYPTSNKQLFKDIEDEHGLILSEYWPNEEPLSWRFPHRNRIVSALSKGTLVAEAAMKSGALITARLCLEQNRELMCLPGLVTNPNTEGIYKLLKDGAHLVTKAQDVLDAMGWKIEVQRQTAAVNNETIQNVSMSVSGLSETEAAIYEKISIEDCSMDKLASEFEMDIGDLMIILTTLELDGLIKQTDGDKYTVS